jgi:hypothetical protein
VTRGPTSKRRPWCPPRAHTHTGRLCSAGSGRHPVLRRRRSYAALRLPRPRRPQLRSPLAAGLPRRGCFFCAEPPAWRRPAARASTGARRVGEWSPGLRGAGTCRGGTWASQVPGPSSCCVPWSYTPPGATPLPFFGEPPSPSGLRRSPRMVHLCSPEMVHLEVWKPGLARATGACLMDSKLSSSTACRHRRPIHPIPP